MRALKLWTGEFLKRSQKNFKNILSLNDMDLRFPLSEGKVPIPAKESIRAKIGINENYRLSHRECSVMANTPHLGCGIAVQIRHLLP